MVHLCPWKEGVDNSKGACLPVVVAHNGIKLSEPQTATQWTAPYPLNPMRISMSKGPTADFLTKPLVQECILVSITSRKTPPHCRGTLRSRSFFAETVRQDQSTCLHMVWFGGSQSEMERTSSDCRVKLLPR